MKKFRVYDQFSNLLVEVPENSNLLNKKITDKLPLIGDKLTVRDRSVIVLGQTINKIMKNLNHWAWDYSVSVVFFILVAIDWQKNWLAGVACDVFETETGNVILELP